MKIMTLITVLLLTPIIISSQTASKLDNSYGFKNFKFGDSKSKWSNQISKSNSVVKNTYIYTGFCCQTAFGQQVKRIMLTFDGNDKLSTIVIPLKYRQQGDVMYKFFLTIKSAFGAATMSDVDDNTGNMIYRWQAKKVAFTSKLTYKGASEGGWEVWLFFTLTKNLHSDSDDY